MQQAEGARLPPHTHTLSPAFLSSRHLRFDFLLLCILDLMTDDYPGAAALIDGI